MAIVPGARIEYLDAPTRPAWTRGDALHLLALAVLVSVSVGVHAWLYHHTFTTARDSIGFAQLALQYESPSQGVVAVPCHTVWDVARRGEPPHPPGYPLAVLAASKLVRAGASPTPEAMLKSAQLASITAAALLVFPAYALGCLLFGRFAGFAAAVWFQLLPVAAHITSDGLTESWYLLLLTTAAALGTWAVRGPRFWRYFASGAASGAAYLVRPEGLIVTLAVVTVLAGLALRGRSALRALVAQLLGTALVAAPYMALVGGLTLKPGGQGVLQLDATSSLGLSLPLFGSNFNAAFDGPKALWVPQVLFKESAKAFHHVGLFYAIAGVVVAAGLVRHRPWVAVPLVLGAGNTLLIAILAGRAGYLSERHTLPVVLVGTLFAAYAMQELPRLLRGVPVVGPLVDRPATKWVTLAAVLASCVPSAVKPLHENREGHRLIGAYLKEHAAPGDVIIDPYNWAQYYSGRSLRGVPRDPDGAAYRWAILEEGEAPHSTLTRLKAAENVRDDTANKAAIAFVWPDPPDDKKSRRIVLYKQAVKP